MWCERINESPLSVYRDFPEVREREWQWYGLTGYGIGTHHACGRDYLGRQSWRLIEVMDGGGFSGAEKRKIVGRFFEAWAEGGEVAGRGFVEFVEGEDRGWLEGL